MILQYGPPRIWGLFNVRFLYIFLLYMVLPFLYVRAWWRSRKHAFARPRLLERFGFYRTPVTGVIWLHAVSMGETIAALPLIRAIQAAYPQFPLLITSMTLTGSTYVKSVFGETVHQAFLCYDYPGAAHRFLKAYRPVMGIVMETEIWPNLFMACEQQGVPLCLLNARLSEKSAAGYARFSAFTKSTLRKIQWIAASAEEDAKRFIKLGADVNRVSVSGNIKYDLVISDHLLREAANWRDANARDRFVWVAASTHEGEETIILAAHEILRKEYPTALLILVPRHPERFDSVYAMAKAGFATKRRSQISTCAEETAVYLGDTMGELMFFYAVSDVSFVGGSLIPRGGHNILEAAALAKPVLSGPHVFNFETIVADFKAARAITIVNTQEALAAALIQFAKDPSLCEKQGKRGCEVVSKKRGALGRQLAVIDNLFQPYAVKAI